MNTLKKAAAALAVALAVAVSASAAAQTVKVDPSLAGYQRVSGISGNLNSIGSDTLNNLMTYWAEGFKKSYPNVNIQIEGKGSSTAPPALIEGHGTARPDVARDEGRPRSTASRRSTATSRPGVRVALDGLAVYVNKDNPIEKLTLKQLDAIFSSTRKRGGKDVKTWGDLGLTGDWANKPISLFGRNSASGTYGYFKEHALENGDYKNSVKEQPGSSSVVQGVAEDKYAIGYSGVGYTTSGVKTVPALREGRRRRSSGSRTRTSSPGKYPLARYLNVYVNKAPGKPLDPLVKRVPPLRALEGRARRSWSRTASSRCTAKVAGEEIAKLN